QPVLAVHLLAFAHIGLVGHQLVVPDILSSFHRNINACSLYYYYIGNARSVCSSLIHVGLEWQRLAAPEEAVCSNYYLGLGIENPAVQTAAGESGEDHAV